MTMEEICEILSQHRQSIGKRDLLQIEIAEAKETLKIMQRTVAEDVAAPGAQNVTGMPKGNAVGNPTECLGLMLASGDAPRHIAQLKTDIAELKRELHDLTIRINRVVAWLASLSERESWVITGHMIDGLTWYDMTEDYQRRYGQPRTRRSLQRLKRQALRKIAQMAK